MFDNIMSFMTIKIDRFLWLAIIKPTQFSLTILFDVGISIYWSIPSYPIFMACQTLRGAKGHHKDALHNRYQIEHDNKSIENYRCKAFFRATQKQSFADRHHVLHQRIPKRYLLLRDRQNCYLQYQ